jgi:hypothetical protein
VDRHNAAADAENERHLRAAHDLAQGGFEQAPAASQRLHALLFPQDLLHVSLRSSQALYARDIELLVGEVGTASEHPAHDPAEERPAYETQHRGADDPLLAVVRCEERAEEQRAVLLDPDERSHPGLPVPQRGGHVAGMSNTASGLCSKRWNSSSSSGPEGRGPKAARIDSIAGRPNSAPTSPVR